MSPPGKLAPTATRQERDRCHEIGQRLPSRFECVSERALPAGLEERLGRSCSSFRISPYSNSYSNMTWTFSIQLCDPVIIPAEPRVLSVAKSAIRIKFYLQMQCFGYTSCNLCYFQLH